MAQHGHHGDELLPHTWPFRAAGTLVILALSWFCLGFAVEDAGDELPIFFPLFWAAILVALVLVMGGAAINYGRERRRRAAL